MDELTSSTISRIRKAKTLDESTEILRGMLSCPIAVWEDGTLYEIKKLVDKVDELKIEVYAREHSPPHFHVIGNNVDATFSLEEGRYLNGRIGGKALRLIIFWHEHGGREKIIEAWNSSRPTNCPVGTIIS